VDLPLFDGRAARRASSRARRAEPERSATAEPRGVDLVGRYSNPRQQSNDPFHQLLQMYRDSNLHWLGPAVDNRRVRSAQSRLEYVRQRVSGRSAFLPAMCGLAPRRRRHHSVRRRACEERVRLLASGGGSRV